MPQIRRPRPRAAFIALLNAAPMAALMVTLMAAAALAWSAPLQAQQPTEVEVFVLEHRLAGELEGVVAPLVAPDGVVRAQGNNLIVRAPAARMAQIRGVIDRLAMQLAPLPPRNMASVVVTALQYLKSEKARGRQVAVPDLPLCPIGTR